METRSSSRLAEWLDNLARESWQLELIISGFAIFLLIGLQDPLQELGLAIRKQDSSWELRNVISAQS